MKRENVIIAVSSLLIVLLTYAAISKAMDLEQFRIQIYQIEYLRPFTTVISIAIPVVEIIISILLLFTNTRPVGLYAAFILMAIFSLYVAILLTFSPHLPCACGGAIQNLTWSQHLMVNITFTSLALWSCMLLRRSKKAQTNTSMSTVN